jgi:hypothetical protein
MRIVKSLLQSINIGVPIGHFLLRAFIVCIVVSIVLSEVIAMLWNTVDWRVVLSILPDWVIPDVLQDIADKVVPSGLVEPSSPKHTVMPDGTVIDEKGMRFPFRTKGDEE